MKTAKKTKQAVPAPAPSAAVPPPATRARLQGRTRSDQDRNKMKPKAQRGTTPAAAPGTSAAADRAALPMAAASTVPSPVTGVIRLDLSSITPAGLVAYLHDLIEGLTGNPYYNALPAGVISNLIAARTAMNSVMDTIVYLEGQLRAARAAQETRSPSARKPSATRPSPASRSTAPTKLFSAPTGSCAASPAPPSPWPPPPPSA